MVDNDEYIKNIKYLSNEKLIDDLEYCGHDGYYNIFYYPIIKEIKRRLPSNGKWIIYGDDLFPTESTQECSICHHEQKIYYGNDDNFCPNCGAHMETMMSDLISRKALCDDLREYKVSPVPVSSDESEVKGYNDGIDLAISVIAKFPSVKPERKTGHWIDTDNYYQRWKCSECGYHTRDAEPNYCPNCGIKMEREN